MELEKYAPIFALLLGVGVIFGTFEEFSSGGSFGFPWFVKMLWFVVGFVVLLIVGILLFSAAIKAEAKILAEKS